MWINHHRLFTHIKRSDNMLLVLNLLLLLGVTAQLERLGNCGIVLKLTCPHPLAEATRARLAGLCAAQGRHILQVPPSQKGPTWAAYVRPRR